MIMFITILTIGFLFFVYQAFVQLDRVRIARLALLRLSYFERQGKAFEEVRVVAEQALKETDL